VLVKRFSVKYKKTLLVVLTIVFASCGGGGGPVAVVNNATQAVSNLTSGFLLMAAVY
jgi:hypothetical protein